MNETVNKYRSQITEFWKTRTNIQKSGIIGGVLAIIILIVAVTFMASSPRMVPLYSNLSLQEAGQLKTELDEQGITYEIENGGSTILVPEAQSDGLLVDFASRGIPNSGNIDYSFFSDNVSWGMTDEERQIIEVDAMQTELSQLIQNIEGISDARVLINRARETIFVGEEQEQSSASIVLSTDYGYEFNQNQVQGLYHLVSKAVPNLSPEDIVIMNQYFEYYDLDGSGGQGSGSTYAEHQQIKKDIEKDIQRRVQKLLGTMIGQDKVVVSVTTDVDFAQENRVEEIVEPVDMESMEGLPVSVDRITETYTGYDGNQMVEGEGDIPELPATEDQEELSEYEMVRETINNEFNRIRSEIVESPYEVRDLGIQVAVDNTVEENNEVVTLNEAEQVAVEEDIQSILSSVIQTSISSNVEDLNPADKVSIVFQEFSGTPDFGDRPTGIPTWFYIVGAILILAIVVLVFFLLRNRDRRVDSEEVVQTETTEIEDYSMEENQSESTIRRKRLENLAKEKPDEFAKLLRTWISED
ncbi:flagellar M-ring protein FliF [Halalkalibacillus sediminis]|uniref:Flagellar M-ring protein n=1 Tax=Halalkalibacillus sediminis TaxID=2018042 RepID=A0A2I0QW93_9BACI|nr:flagellar basal-body MS-ring/collar protein FliF [Halalkalibacillus sediminis]PKR78617.1 flagellar M-ring protein FliF [Halalkalibacillus sediminis]